MEMNKTIKFHNYNIIEPNKLESNCFIQTSIQTLLDKFKPTYRIYPDTIIYVDTKYSLKIEYFQILPIGVISHFIRYEPIQNTKDPTHAKHEILFSEELDNSYKFEDKAEKILFSDSEFREFMKPINEEVSYNLRTVSFSMNFWRYYVVSFGEKYKHIIFNIQSNVLKRVSRWKGEGNISPSLYKIFTDAVREQYVPENPYLSFLSSEFGPMNNSFMKFHWYK